ncbi:hypothetical protein K466DRAFT_342883 [Polyporus arcularius HHB13444]|uniref:Uncharacterized protein n=1 Tax=Polyporus arcularius HHB13444 TaxID=1314778 RepID=A0A5C3PP64_9APHY|nr:hypothetical protein K466DRAFT_342883 [Polyporus arcularius HHB13444]
MRWELLRARMFRSHLRDIRILIFILAYHTGRVRATWYPGKPSSYTSSAFQLMEVEASPAHTSPSQQDTARCPSSPIAIPTTPPRATRTVRLQEASTRILTNVRLFRLSSSHHRRAVSHDSR